MAFQAQAWHIEYTNHPPLKKKRKKILERAIAGFIEEIELLLKVKADKRFILGDTNFYVESTWLDVTNEKTVDEKIAELEENLGRADRTGGRRWFTSWI